jgi:hypothetical protein
MGRRKGSKNKPAFDVDENQAETGVGTLYKVTAQLNMTFTIQLDASDPVQHFKHRKHELVELLKRDGSPNFETANVIRYEW